MYIFYISGITKVLLRIFFVLTEFEMTIFIPYHLPNPDPIFRFSLISHPLSTCHVATSYLPFSSSLFFPHPETLSHSQLTHSLSLGSLFSSRRHTHSPTPKPRRTTAPPTVLDLPLSFSFASVKHRQPENRQACGFRGEIRPTSATLRRETGTKPSFSCCTSIWYSDCTLGLQFGIDRS